MPTRQFIKASEVGPITVEANEDGSVNWPSTSGGASTATAGIAMLAFDVNSSGSDLAAFGFTAPQIAAATKARVSCYSGEAAYAYIDTAGAGVSLAHPLAAGETVIIEGAANVAGLVVYAAMTATIIITLEGPAA